MTFKVKSGIRVNTVDVIDQFGNFTGNAFLGAQPVAVNRGGTGATTAANARINLFGDITPDGLLVKTSTGQLAAVAITSGTGVVVTDGAGTGGNPTIAIGQNVATTADVTFNSVTINGTLNSNDITATRITADGDLIVTGNLIVEGNVTTLNTEEIQVEDNEIRLNANITGSPVLDAFITIERGSSANVDLKWNETVDRWQFTNDGSIHYNIPIPEEYDNVIYNISIENSDTPANGANVRLTGTSGTSGNVKVIDDIKLVGSGLVTVTKQDDNTIEISAAGSVSSTTTGITDSVANVLDVSNISQFRSIEYFYTATSTSGGTKYTTGKIIVLHDGSTTYNNQYGMLQSDPNNEVVLLTTDINNGNVRLLAQATSGLEAKVVLNSTFKTPV